MAGLALLNAVPRPPGIEVLWVETAGAGNGRSPLGRGRLMSGALRADGTLDLTSRAAVLDADVEYRFLRNHTIPRVVGSGMSLVYADLGAQGKCEAIRLLPTPAPVRAPAAACALAPDRLGRPIPDAELARLETILANEPRRVFGQPKNDIGLVAWAGDRAYWQHGTQLRSNGPGGSMRDEPTPFPASRSRIAWGSVALDGEAVAWVDGKVVHRGDTLTRAELEEKRALGALSERGTSMTRNRAVRVGTTWWTARGQPVEVWPKPGRRPSVSLVTVPPGEALPSSLAETSHDTSFRVWRNEPWVGREYKAGTP